MISSKPRLHENIPASTRVEHARTAYALYLGPSQVHFGLDSGVGSQFLRATTGAVLL